MTLYNGWTDDRSKEYWNSQKGVCPECGQNVAYGVFAGDQCPICGHHKLERIPVCKCSKYMKPRVVRYERVVGGVVQPPEEPVLSWDCTCGCGIIHL
jgi:hypothetical protein